MTSAEAPGTDAAQARPGRRTLSLLRVEDWLLAGWVLAVAPILARLEPAAGPFDGGQPAQGILRLGAVLAAFACVTARSETPAGRSVAQSAAVGPLAGGVLLVALSGGTALGLGSTAVPVYMAMAGAVAVVARFALPPLAAPLRRALVTPLVLVSGGLFWSVLDAIRGAGLTAAASPRIHLDPGTWLPATGFFLAFSGVYYAMLVYAPRQVAEREGGPVTWVVRYALFVAGTLLGVGWAAQLGT